MSYYDEKMLKELRQLESKRVKSLIAERKLNEKQVADLGWLAGVLRSLDMGDGTPDVVAYVQMLGDEYPVQMVGAKVWAKAQKLAAKYEVNIRFYREVKFADGLSDSYKSWVNTKAHGEVENSVTYVHEEDGRRLLGYDGDEDFDNTKSLSDQLNRSYTIPYVRYQAAGDYTEVKWLKESPEGKLSNPVKGISRTKGEIRKHKAKDGREFNVFAIYVAKSLDSKGFLVQDRLEHSYSNEEWGKFNVLLSAQKEYKAGMRDRAISVETGIRKIVGWYGKPYDQRVYYMSFDGFILYSVVPTKELPDSVQKEIQLKRDYAASRRKVWAIYNAFKARVEEDVCTLTEVKEAMGTFLKGDDVAWDIYHSALVRFATEVGMRAPWLFKGLLKPFYKDLFLGRKVVNVSLFDDKGDIL